MKPTLICKHCGRVVSRWDDRWAEKMHGRSPLYVHDDLVDGATDANCDGVDCLSNEVNYEDTFAEPEETV